MSNYFPEVYRQLEKEINQCIAQKTNLLIITLPGLGATHLLQHFLTLHPQSQINYTNTSDQPISDTYNFLDVSSDQIENYFNTANYQQKFAVVINQPNFIDSEKYLKSTLPKKFPKAFYLGAFDESDTNIFIDLINSNIDQSNRKLIYQLSGGISRLIKFFCTNPELINQKIDDVVQNRLLINIINPTIQVISKTDTTTLQKLNVTLSPIIKHFLKKPGSEINIKINFDLTFSENNQLNSIALNKIESKILKYLIENGNSITREKIAELKWGENHYDEFSDLAITKTMRRLRHKLSVYTLKTVPKIGYALV